MGPNGVAITGGGNVVRLGLALFAMPGVVFHELSHLIFCKMVGARVHQVVFFRLGNPAGFVIHAAPAQFSGHFAIVVGPFLINSAVAFVIFRSSSPSWISLSVDDPSGLILPLLALWWGMAIGLQAFPSKGDANSLWRGANAHLRKGNFLAAAGYPVVALIYVANYLRFTHVDFAYALLLFVLASVL